MKGCRSETEPRNKGEDIEIVGRVRLLHSVCEGPLMGAQKAVWLWKAERPINGLR